MGGTTKKEKELKNRKVKKKEVVKKEKKRKKYSKCKKEKKRKQENGGDSKDWKNTTNKIIKSMPMITNNKSRKGAIEKK